MRGPAWVGSTVIVSTVYPYLLIYLHTYLYDACEVDGGALLYVPLLRPHDDGLGLDDPQVHAVLEVRRGADLVAALGQAVCVTLRA